MPNRTIRDGILDSERMARLSWGAEVFYRRLMSVADDYGRYHANLVLLKAKMYPLQQAQATDEQIEGWISECAQAVEGEEPLISVYLSSGKRYLQINNFGQAVRSKSKFPAPPVAILQASASNCEHLLASASRAYSDTNTQSSSTHSSKEGGAGGNKSSIGPVLVRPSLVGQDRFDDFWFPYCEQTGKPVTEEDRQFALSEWAKLAMPDKLLAVRFIPAYVLEANPSHPRFFKSPAAYLKAKSWTAIAIKPQRSEPKGIPLEEIA